jgi:hypothetical protein
VRRSDPRPLLMGQTTVRYHVVADKKYAPDVMFGVPTSDDFVLPVTDPSVINEFCNDFRLQRNREPGLSVVVPYAHDDITPDAIAKAVAHEYFFPILKSKLIVKIESQERSLTLDSNSLVDSIGSDDGDIEGDLRSLIMFAIWAKTLPQSEIRQLDVPPIAQAPTWSSSLFPSHTSTNWPRNTFKGSHSPCGFLFLVRASSGEEQLSYFDLFLRQDLEGRGYPPVFIRNGIVIPKALERRVRGHRLLSLVTIDDKPLADMLGDAETPAHTQWSQNSQNFSGKYQNGKACLDFVRSAPRQVAEILSSKDRERDPRALADFFPRPRYARS